MKGNKMKEYVPLLIAAVMIVWFFVQHKTDEPETAVLKDTIADTRAVEKEALKIEKENQLAIAEIDQKLSELVNNTLPALSEDVKRSAAWAGDKFQAQNQRLESAGKALEILTVRQASLEKKLIGVNKTVNLRFDNTLQFEPIKTAVKPIGQGAEALLKKAGVKK